MPVAARAAQEATIKRVLITGANKGIGLASAQAVLEQHGDATVLLGSRDPVRGQAAIDSLCNQRPEWASRLESLAIDVSSEQSVAAARDRVSGQFDADATPLYGCLLYTSDAADDLVSV